MTRVLSVNVGRAAPNPYKDALTTGIDKRPVDGPVEVRAPGPKHGGLGSGVVGDHIGDRKHHGGDEQAVYAYAREDLDRWEGRLERELANGVFGENLTTSGIALEDCRLGERWRVGTCELVVTVPRIPCSTFRGWLDVRGWLRKFTADARPGTYLSVAVPGEVTAGDAVEVLHRPDHDVTVEQAFLAIITRPDLAPSLLDAEPHLTPELRRTALRRARRAAEDAPTP
ncbi:MOSC domain-containing protein [Desertihabitans brevis]|uniref:MOSC domain-containing protein n=1 Tax=Desertihabitans brevis TaxID=2268447 RepID=A0A367YV21_9ACTN|nr:MOSC domain-containing protein [Desertihabitans brevis]RCK69723.1 MOSC domain-containing protein [Desertihabitans brevis]